MTSGCLLVARPGRAETVALLTVLIIVCAQALWLLPVLDARLEAVIAGAPPSSIHHRLYIAAEASKALALFVLSLAAFRSAIAGIRDRSVRGPLAKVMERR